MSSKEMELVDIPPVDINPWDDTNSLETDTLLPPSNELSENDLKILKSSPFEDFCGATADAKALAPLSAVLFALIGIYIALDPFGNHVRQAKPMTADEFVSRLAYPNLYALLIY